MSDFLLNKDSIVIDLSASSIDVSGHALVFNRGAFAFTGLWVRVLSLKD
jgi:hypothetical protein